MLDENTKISLRNVVAALIFIGGIVYGWQVTVGSIENRLSVLESEQRAGQDYRKENSERLKNLEQNQVKLMMAFGVKPVEE
jgi:uncharacterized protein HemX